MGKNNVPQSYLDSLQKEEGDISYIYLDTSSKPTSGTGHQLSKKEYKDFGITGWAKKKIDTTWYDVAVNKDEKFISVSESQKATWLKLDSKESYEHAIKQAKELGITDSSFIDRLAHVNYQLGPGWKNKDKFENVWKGLKSKNYQSAIDNIKWINPSNPQEGISHWYDETKERAKKFQGAIENLKLSSDTSSLIEAWNKEDNIFA